MMFPDCLGYALYGLRFRAIALAMIVPILVAGCEGAEPPLTPASQVGLPTVTGMPVLPTETVVSPTAMPVAPAPTQEPLAVSQGFVLEGVGFSTPESVLHDPENDVYLVANIQGSPSAKDGDGFVSRISPEGDVIALKWIDGAAEGVTLNAPKGMALVGERLYVADIDTLRVFDRDSGDSLEERVVEGARFLNDVAAARDGTVYVTDSGTGVIHRFNPDGSWEPAGQTKNPNGIQVRGERILVTGGSDQIFRLDSDGALLSEYETPSGGLDGLVLPGDGSVLVSSWAGAAIYRFDADGQVSELFSGINAPADIGFDTKRKLVLIPHFEEDRVEARPLPSIETSLASFEIAKDVPYVTSGHDKQKLDIYLPTSGDEPFPTLFVIHGGGRDKRDLAHWGRHFVQQGYAVVSINYRDMSLFDYPAPVQDAFCALGWAHANAGAYGLDPGRIVVLGHSMGGTLTAMLGTVDDPDLFSEGCPHQLPEADLIQGVIPFTGVFDCASAARFSPERGSRLERYLGAKLDQSPEIWAEASATAWVDGSEPPFLLIHGTEDEVFDPAESMGFAKVLEQAGVDVELLLIPDADHGAIIYDEQSFEAVEGFLKTLAHTATSTAVPPTDAPESTTVPPTVTPGLPLSGSGGGRIVFSSRRGEGDYEVYVMNADGTDKRRVTRDSSESEEPVWSPDGTRIAYNLDNYAGHSDIYVINPDGTNKRRLTTDGNAGTPAWSPDSTWIAFSRHAHIGDSDLYLMNTGGSELQQLTRLGSGMQAFSPSWSPDGKYIACVVDFDPDPKIEDLTICVLDVQGGLAKGGATEADLRPLPRVAERLNDRPDWSPVGPQIVFSAVVNYRRDLYVVNVDGTDLRQLTDTPDQDEFSPAWSPDGTQIVFQANPDAQWDIFAMNADGTDRRRLTTDVANDTSPDWAP
jgi:Tol biopolymer transport system component/acetyl esterase/lipase